MKTLSIRQPWAFAICNLPKKYQKDIENRTWNTKYKGDFLIHAGKTFDKEGYERLKTYLHELGYDGKIPKADEFVLGAIIGVSELTNVANNDDIYCLNTDSIWYEGDYGFVLKNSRAFKNPIPYKGKLNFFEVDNNLVRSELEDSIASIPKDSNEFKVGDIVVCRPEAFDVITKISKRKSGAIYFEGSHEIKEIKGDLCRFDTIGIGYTWMLKDDLVLKTTYENFLEKQTKII